MDHRLRRLLQRFERADDGRKLHAVIGRRFLAAGQFAFVRARTQNRCPTAGPWISGTGAVGIDIDAAHKPYSAALRTLLWKRSRLE